MPYAPFHEFFPEVAMRETRSVTVPPDSDTGVPPGEYGFLELFCNEKGCDCRRVFLYVVSAPKNDVHAVIAYGWESPAFYSKWMGDNDPTIIDSLRGPCLNLGSPESAAAPALLDLFRNVLLRDTAYLGRIKRHYRMFREKVEGAGAGGRQKPERKRKKGGRWGQALRFAFQAVV